MAEITVEEFIKRQEQEEYPLQAESLAAIKKALLDHKAPIEPIAAKIAEPILEAEKKRAEGLTANYSNGTLWRVIAAAIQQMTSQMDRIVELIVAITKVPDSTGFLAFNQDMNEHWNEFAMGCKWHWWRKQDHADSHIVDEPAINDPNRAAIRQAWINMNAFNAKISTLGMKKLDYSLRSAHVFRIALEETPWEQYHVPEVEEELEEDPEDPDTIALRDELLEQRSVRRLNYWAPAAAAWIEYDGKGIYNMHGPMIGDDYENYEATNWSGARGFSKERFHYWMERFEWVAKVTALDHNTRQRAAHAAAQMKRIEVEG